MATPSERILSFEQARHMVEEHASRVRPSGVEEVGLLETDRRVLAEPIHADRDLPPFRRAARDGYAVRASDLENLPTTLQVVGEIRAGANPANPPTTVARGQAAAIMTGAPAPEGADAVVMAEYTSRMGDRVKITRAIQVGDNIVPLGSEARQGELLLSPGTRIGEATVGLMASVGKTKVRVYRKPKVAILSTGDEVVGIDVQPGPNQIRNSNSYSLATQVRIAGGEPVVLPIAPDERNRLCELIEIGLRSDLLLMAGGVSMGKYDLVEQVMAQLQAEFFFTGAEIQPGRPIVFGRVGPASSPSVAVSSSPRHDVSPSAVPTYFFGLPGNPVSTMVTFELFALPMLEALGGMTPRKLIFLRARLKAEIKTRPGLKRFLPAILSGELENAEVELARWGGSGDLAQTARANCYLVIPPDGERIPPGAWVPILPRH